MSAADLTFIIDVKKPIAKYFEWELFLNPLAKPEGYDRRMLGLFVGKRVMDGKVIGNSVKGETLKSLQNKIDKERKSSVTFRNKCKTLLIDTRKCDYCPDRFLCFTERKRKQ